MSATATAHGFDGTLVKPDWAPLQLAEVRALLRDFPGCDEPIKILTVSPRPLSAASVVSTRNRKLFIKRHSQSVRDREGLLEEHRLLRHLKEHGAPVLRVLQNRAGETAIEMDQWTYEVHEAGVGVDLYGEALSWTPFRSVAHARSAGTALARLHCAAEGYDAPARPPRPLVASLTIFADHDVEASLRRYLAARPSLAQDAKTRRAGEDALETLAPLHAEILPLLSSLKPLWTHNDLHASNVLWSDESSSAQVARVFDFGLSDRTNAVHDLAHAIERNIVEWLSLPTAGADGRGVHVHLDHLAALLDGYEQMRSLTDEEVAALAPMVALCHAEYALSEADYYLGVLDSSASARVASEDYLVGHARWYRSAGGAQLLDWLRSWAYRRERR